MLAQTLFFLMAIAIFATSAIAGIAGYARAETASAAKALVAPSIETAVARYLTTVIAPAIAAAYRPGDATAAPLAVAELNGGRPWSAQTYVLAPNAPSPLAAVVTIAPTAISVPACSPAGGSVNAGPDVQRNGQCSRFVQESRLSLALTVDVGPPSGAATVTSIAHDRTTVTLRLFAQPPFAAISGIADAPVPGDPHESDAGGYGNATGAFGPISPGDTTIHVIYACTPAQGDCSASDPAPADRPTSLPWTNGNTN